MNGRVSRAEHVAEASRTLWRKRGEKPCTANHDTPAIEAGEPCPQCKASR